MSTRFYKGYTIVTVGISRYIYRPGKDPRLNMGKSDGYAQSEAEAIRWINKDRN